jgi:hypothetical protein
MRRSKWILAMVAMLLALGTASILGGETPARGQNTGGPVPCVISQTHVITSDAWLVCDVQCTEVDTPCIQFGKSNIKLSLRGFKLTGPADPPTTNCAALPPAFPPADGIHSGYDDVVIEGPGLVQRMGRHGIALIGGSLRNPADPPDSSVDKAVVKKLTSHQNCYSGVFLAGVTESLVEEVVSVKNAAASAHLTCGGVCITNSNRNRIRRSEFAGNGSAALGRSDFPFCPVTVPSDFGVGLTGTSSGNIIEENGIGGNINGVLVCPNAGTSPLVEDPKLRPNLIRKNVIAGNPPIQVSVSPGVDPAPDPVGADIRDFSPPGANRFEDNLCITYIGSGPPPCPNITQFSGHQNN